jgi:hypothetical protein
VPPRRGGVPPGSSASGRSQPASGVTRSGRATGAVKRCRLASLSRQPGLARRHYRERSHRKREILNPDS